MPATIRACAAATESKLVGQRRSGLLCGWPPARTPDRGPLRRLCFPRQRGGAVSQATADKLIALPGAVLAFSAALMGGPDEMIEMPVPTFLIEHPKGLVLFDTGCNLKIVEEGAGYIGDFAGSINIRFTRDDVVDAQLRH